MLRRNSFSVLEAENGIAAIQIFGPLPGLGGGEVITQLWQSQPDLKVILTTAYSEEDAVRSVGGQQVWTFSANPTVSLRSFS